MHLSREIYEQSQATGKAKKRLSKDLLAVRRHIHELRRSRALRRQGCDPLIARSMNRQAMFKARRDRRRETDVRNTLLRAARIARAMGFNVRSSKFDGRVSSYYCRAGNHHVRISDHEIPWTPAREARGGGFNGYAGAQIIIDRKRRDEWLRRAILLADAGRSVPGAN